MAERKDITTDQVHGKVDHKTHREETSDVCEPCNVDNNMLPAVGWCQTCDEMLCKDCYTYHCKPKSMRHHQLMSIDDMKNMKQKKRLSIKCDERKDTKLLNLENMSDEVVEVAENWRSQRLDGYWSLGGDRNDAIPVDVLKKFKLLNLEKTTDEVVEVVEVMRFKRFKRYNAHLIGDVDTNDAIQVSTDHDIRLQHVLVYARYGGDTEVHLSINEGGKCLMRCYGRYEEEAATKVVAVNVIKEGGAGGVTLQAGHPYVINMKRGEWGYSYYGEDVLSNATTVTFTNTKGTNTDAGIIAGLRFILI